MRVKSAPIDLRPWLLRDVSAQGMADDHEWEADVYERVAQPHEDWAQAVLDRLALQGTDVALDAGCGTGKLTTELVKRIPRGRVVGVDRSPAMIREARRRLPSSVELRVQDLTELTSDEPFDIVVSSATFHWIADHDALFANLRAVMRPGGRLEAQCGGAGNVANAVEAVDRLAARAPWRSALSGWAGPWNFADPATTETRLRRSGFTQVRCWLEPHPVRPVDPPTFLRTIVLGAHLARVPPESHGAFIDELCEEMARADRTRGGPGEQLDYVRLNISATRATV
jgi:trans-aconitate 2-methyltransferase